MSEEGVCYILCLPSRTDLGGAIQTDLGIPEFKPSEHCPAGTGMLKLQQHCCTILDSLMKCLQLHQLLILKTFCSKHPVLPKTG